MNNPDQAPCFVELRPRAGHGNIEVVGLAGIHHFCFATFQRLERLEWGALRGLNEYRLAPGAIREATFHAGFDIVTLVTAGSLQRIGTYAPRQPLVVDSAELVSTGRGVNLGMENCTSEPATYVEIWIRTGPGRRDSRRTILQCAERRLDRAIASGVPFGAGALKLRAAASLAWGSLPEGERKILELEDGNCAYISVRSGLVTGNGVTAAEGDAIALSGPGSIIIEAKTDSELLQIITEGVAA